MANKRSNVRRVVVAVSETGSLQDLWRVVREHVDAAQAELVTVFVSDDRWRRAASLPFTREFSRVSGGSTDFTLTRAEQVDQEAVDEAQSRLRQLATEAQIQFAFEILAEHEARKFHDFVTSESDVLIAPSFFKRRPIFTELSRLKCRIVLVDTQDVTERQAGD